MADFCQIALNRTFYSFDSILKVQTKSAKLRTKKNIGTGLHPCLRASHAIKLTSLLSDRDFFPYLLSEVRSFKLDVVILSRINQSWVRIVILGFESSVLYVANILLVLR